jgi:excisionase family DNA binding protein
MPRQRKRPLFPICLTVAETATVLGCPLARIKRAISDGTITAYAMRGNRSVLLTEDIVRMVRAWPKARAQKNQPHEVDLSVVLDGTNDALAELKALAACSKRVQGSG